MFLFSERCPFDAGGHKEVRGVCKSLLMLLPDEVGEHPPFSPIGGYALWPGYTGLCRHLGWLVDPSAYSYRKFNLSSQAIGFSKM